MRNAVCAAVLLCVAMTAHAAPDLLCSTDVLNRSWDLLREGGWGLKRTERAAFVVREGSGYDFVAWPVPTESYRADFVGRIPANAVAIIHTHPNDVPQPSDGDLMTASRTGLAVYVLTRTRIMEVSDGRVSTAWTGDWNPAAPAGSHSVCRARTLVAASR